VVTGSTHYAYVSNNGSSPPTIGFYTATAATSPYLSPNTPATVPNSASVQTVLDPNGLYFYMVDDEGSLWLWNISATGVPTISAQPTVPSSGSTDIFYGLIDPYGRFLYLADSGATSSIYAYQISQTNGTLTPVTGSPFTANLNAPQGLVVDHTGTYLYATNNGNGTVSAYQIDQTSGALTALTTGATITTGTSASAPVFETLDPTGTYLYAANSGDQTVASFSIGTGGALTSLGANLSVPGATNVLNVAVAPNGKILYVLDAGTSPANGQVFGFTLTSGVPATTPVSGTPAATGLAPTGIAIDPTGVLIAVDNSGSGNISLFSVGSGGGLTVDTPATAGTNPILVTFYDAP
jgi:6-phosphogluconolactonase (cycloisomerase 2 family)